MVDTVSEKYSSTTENDTKKLVIDNGSYALCEMLEILIDKIGRLTSTISIK